MSLKCVICGNTYECYFFIVGVCDDCEALNEKEEEGGSDDIPVPNGIPPEETTIQRQQEIHIKPIVTIITNEEKE